MKKENMKQLLGGIGVVMIFFCGSSVFAQSALFRYVDQGTINRGYTFSYDQGAFQVGLSPRALSEPGNIRMAQEYAQENGSALASPPQGLIFGSAVYSYAFSDDSTLLKNITVVIKSPTGDALSALYRYNTEKKQWQRLPTVRVSAQVFRTSSNVTSGSFALLRYENEDAELSALLGTSRALMVADTEYHTFVAQNTSEPLPLASLTKLMTALVFLDAKMPWDKKVSILARDDAEPAKINFALGDIVTTKDLFYSMLIGSKNNSAKALARSTGMSEKDFLKKMNQKAVSLGMVHTAFKDVTGLDAQSYSTARDYYRLIRVALRNADIKKAAQTRSYTVAVVNRKKRFRITTTDELLDGTVYGKTGYIPEVGYNLALLSEKEDKPIIVLVFGAPSSDERFQLASAILRHTW